MSSLSNRSDPGRVERKFKADMDRTISETIARLCLTISFNEQRRKAHRVLNPQPRKNRPR